MQPAYEGIDSVYKSKADNKDIRDLLEQLVPKAKAQMVEFSNQFKGATEQQTCRKIFTYLKNNFRYVADGGEQVIKLPSALLKKKVGDCKSYSLFTAAILENLKIPYHFVYASYNSNPIPGHVYVTTNNGCIIDAVYGTFNKEKKPNYKYKKNMNVRYMAGIKGCGCGGNCSCNNAGMGKITIISKEKRDKAAADLNRLRDKAAEELKEKARQLENYTKEQARKAEENAKILRDKALEEAKEKARKLENYTKEQLRAAEETAKKLRDKILQGLKTGGLSGGRALFLLMIQNNLDGFATKLSTGDTSNLINSWYKLGGDRTKLAKALKTGASKPEKKFGFLPKLNKIYDKASINGMGETDETKKDNLGRKQANEAIEQYKMDGNIQGLIGGLCTATGTTIGAAVGAAGGLTAGVTAAIGTGVGAALSAIIIGLTPVIVNAVRKTPKTDNPDSPLTTPTIDPSSLEVFEQTEGSTYERDSTYNQTQNKPSGMNLKVILPIAALVVGAGIYFATKKK
jgi:hypothetical protein